MLQDMIITKSLCYEVKQNYEEILELGKFGATIIEPHCGSTTVNLRVVVGIHEYPTVETDVISPQ